MLNMKRACGSHKSIQRDYQVAYRPEASRSQLWQNGFLFYQHCQGSLWEAIWIVRASWLFSLFCNIAYNNYKCIVHMSHARIPPLYPFHVPYIYHIWLWARFQRIFSTRQMSRDMTKPTKWLCAQRRLRSAWASAQSDQSLRCPHEESLGP